jgi:hypothetical protein
MSKYAPLKHNLEARPREDTTLGFAEIEEILGFNLPRSAYQYDAWWSNEPSTHSQARAWADAGWQVWHVRRSAQSVHFRPIAFETVKTRGFQENAAAFARDDATIAIDRRLLKGGVLRLLEDYREEHGGDLADAAAGVLNEIALERRRRLMEWIRANAPRVPGDSTDLIREDRDAR